MTLISVRKCHPDLKDVGPMTDAQQRIHMCSGNNGQVPGVSGVINDGAWDIVRTPALSGPPLRPVAM